MVNIEVAGEGAMAQALRRAAGRAGSWTLADGTGRPDWVVLCEPQGISGEQVAAWTSWAGGVLCPPCAARDRKVAQELTRLAAQGRAKALRPECFQPWVVGLREVLDGEWLGTVGTVELFRKHPLGSEDVRDALGQCGMEEASVVLYLLGRPQRLFCTASDLGREGEQISLTLQMVGGALVNIQGVQGGTDTPYFRYEYAGQYGLAEYDSRQGGLRWNGNGVVQDPWDMQACTQAVEQALQSPDDNGLTDLLRLQAAALDSAARRQVISWEEAQM